MDKVRFILICTLILSTALGNINLKLDDWANAESERKELINRWGDTYHMDMQPMYFM